jgi:hypothetical protein
MSFFFLSCALNGMTQTRASRRTNVPLMFMTPPFL